MEGLSCKLNIIERDRSRGSVYIIIYNNVCQALTYVRAHFCIIMYIIANMYIHMQELHACTILSILYIFSGDIYLYIVMYLPVYHQHM